MYTPFYTYRYNYAGINDLNVCFSYSAVLKLVGEVSKLHKVPIKLWIEERVTFKVIGDNVGKTKRVRDVQCDHQGKIMHMYSVLVARSHLPSLHLPHTGKVADLLHLPSISLLPCGDDIHDTKQILLLSPVSSLAT